MNHLFYMNKKKYRVSFSEWNQLRKVFVVDESSMYSKLFDIVYFSLHIQTNKRICQMPSVNMIDARKYS